VGEKGYMKIAFDISPLSGGHAGRGTGVYTKQLLMSLKEHTNATIFEWDKNFTLPHDTDIVHHPYFDPFLLTLPLSRKYPTVVTVHDLIPIRYAKYFPKGIKGQLKWQIQKNSLLKAEGIITDSETSKKDIVELLGYPEEKIFVVFLAPSPIFAEQSLQEVNRVKKKYGLSNTFLLYVGDVNWNKNIPRLIVALKSVDVELVLVGKAFLNNELVETREINSLIQSSGCESRVKKLGFVPEVDLPGIYTAAQTYIQPSIAEGFGLPVLEAMACGTPCVVSSKTSVAEIAGPSLLIDPFNELDMREGILKALAIDKSVMKQKNKMWASTFTWAKTATQTMAAYEHVIAL